MEKSHKQYDTKRPKEKEMIFGIRAVMEAIDNLMGRKTLIIIAHRLTTLRNCQLIFKVEGGNVRQVSYEEIADTEEPGNDG